MLLRVSAVVIFVCFAGYYASALHWKDGFLQDYTGHVIGADFVNTWMMGKSALTDAHPESNYEIHAYVHRLRELFGEHYRAGQWSYPPTYMLFASLFGRLPYVLALAAFMLASITAFIFSARAERGLRPQFLTALCSPASYFALIAGQVSLLAAALQLAFFRLLDRRPILAGILLGLLSLKPQLGLVYPFFLIATRRWKTFAAAAATVLALMEASYFIWGQQVWRAYIALGIPAQNTYVLHGLAPVVRVMMPTLFIDLRGMGLSYAAAMTVQGIVALASLSAFFTPTFRRADRALQMLIVATAGLLVTPYLMVYDWVFFICCLLMFLDARPVSRVGFWLLLACFFLPFLHFALGLAGLPGSALLPVALMAWSMRDEKNYQRGIE